MAGQAVLEREEAAQERFLCHRERRHVCSTLTATQNGAKGGDQQFMQVMQTGVAVRGSFSPSKQAIKWSSLGSSFGDCGLPQVESIASESGKDRFTCQGHSKCDSPGAASRFARQGRLPPISDQGAVACGKCLTLSNFCSPSSAEPLQIECNFSTPLARRTGSGQVAVRTAERLKGKPKQAERQ